MKFILPLLVSLFFVPSVLQAKFAPSTVKKYVLDSTKSQLKWMGEKDVYVDAGSRHDGKVNLKEGALDVKDHKITGGYFVIDMDSISNTDLASSPKWAKKLTSHLKSDDFFSTSKYPESRFTITKVEFIKEKSYKVTGKLKIKETEKTVSFPATISKSNKDFVAEGKIKINRLDYGVKYNSKKDFLAKIISIPKDKVIKDHFDLEFKLVAKAK